MMRPRRFAWGLALVLVFAGAGVVLADNSDDDPTDKHPKPPPPKPACYDVTVSFDRARDWDLLKSPPDPLISETTTGAHASCSNTFVCSIRIHPKGNTITLSVYDEDLAFDDFAGGGTCRVGKSCVLGDVTAAMSPC